MTTDESYIKRTFELALRGAGYVSPNPMVGALIVKNGRIIGEGFHQKYGGPHAEVNAINNCSEDLEGATLYCSLEPCCHTKKQTPPCTKIIIEKKIKRVVVAVTDPNPQVAGRGLEILKKAGIEVSSGLLEQEATKLNEVFFKYIKEKVPFVHLKMAQTLDGFAASSSGDSKWITSEVLRKNVHQIRSSYDAILVGSQTVLADNPRLNIRYNLKKRKDPWRVIIGSIEKFSLNENIFTDELKEQTILFTPKIKDQKYKNFCNSIYSSGPFIHESDSYEHNFSLPEILVILAKKKISSVLIEGGPGIATSFLSDKLIDKVTFHIAPKILGSGASVLNSLNISSMSNCLHFKEIKTSILDNHFVFEGYPDYR